MKRAIKSFFRKFLDDSCFQMASSLTYSSIISLVPIITLSFSVMTSLKFFTNFEKQLKEFLFKHFIPTQAQIIEEYINNFTKNLASLNTISLITFFLTGLFLLVTLENILNKIWKTKNKRPLLRSLINYWSFLTAGPLILALSAYIASKYNLFSILPIPQKHFHLMTIITSFSLNFIIFTLIYYLLPSFKPKIESAIIGSLFTSFFYENLKILFSIYIKNVAYQKIYGSLATLPIFFVWLYFVWLIILVGAEISYFVQFPDELENEKYFSFNQIIDELGIFFYIIISYIKDKKVSIYELYDQFYHLKPDQIQLIINNLIRKRMISIIDEKFFIPSQYIDNLILGEIINKVLEINNINKIYENTPVENIAKIWNENNLKIFPNKVIEFLKK